jgi:hypothetical protein
METYFNDPEVAVLWKENKAKTTRGEVAGELRTCNGTVAGCRLSVVGFHLTANSRFLASEAARNDTH